MNKRGEKESLRTIIYLIAAGIIIVFLLGLMGRWFWGIFRQELPQTEAYVLKNFERLADESQSMLDYGDYNEVRVLPFTLKAVGDDAFFALVGINPDLPATEATGCDSGRYDVPSACRNKNCLCLCTKQDCTDAKRCITFEGIRVASIDSSTYSWGLPLDVPDPLGLQQLEQLALPIQCDGAGGPNSGADREQMNLYVEESYLNGQRYLIISEENDGTRRRESVIRGTPNPVCTPAGTTGTAMQSCASLNCCDDCRMQGVRAATPRCCNPAGTTGTNMQSCASLNCCDSCRAVGGGPGPRPPQCYVP